MSVVSISGGHQFIEAPPGAGFDHLCRMCGLLADHAETPLPACDEEAAGQYMVRRAFAALAASGQTVGAPVSVESVRAAVHSLIGQAVASGDLPAGVEVEVALDRDKGVIAMRLLNKDPALWEQFKAVIRRAGSLTVEGRVVRGDTDEPA